MRKSRRVLVLEDSAADAELMLRELQRAGLEVRIQRVDTEQDFAAALSAEPDLILCDYSLPGYDGLSALQKLKASGLDAPLVIVSGTIGEELAVSLMLQGAAAVVMKSRLPTLGPIAIRALGEVEARRENLRAHKALEAEAEFRKAIEDSVGAGILSMDGEGRILRVNAALCRMTGYAKEDLEGAPPPFPYWPETDVEVHRRRLLKNLAGDGVAKTEARFRRRDGAPFDAEVISSPIVGPDGRRMGRVEMIADISARKDAEREKSLREAVVKTQQETSLDGILVVDADRRLISHNRRFREMFAVPAELLQPDSSPDLIRFAMRLYPDPEGLNAHLDGIYARKGEPSREEIRVSDGRLLDVYSAPMSGADGQYLGRVWYFRDVTAEKRAVEALRRGELSLKKAQSLAHIGSWSFDIATGEVAWSEEAYRICGMPPRAPMRLADFFALVHPEDLPGLKKAWEGALNGAPFCLEHRILVGGEVRWLSDVAEVERAPDGRPLHCVGTAQDVTERKLMEQRILQSQKMESIGLLAGGMAHDFNNILMAILANAGFVLAGLDRGDRRRADVEEIQKAAERAAALTRQLLIFSRRQVAQTATFDLNELIRNLAKMLGRLLGEDVKAELLLSPSPAVVTADPGQLEQVVVNLAANARDAMPKGGRLSIRTAAEGGAVRLMVEDSGVGMSPEALAHLYEPFFTTKPAGKGTGLGLSSVYGIVRQAKGEIAVKSEPGKGTLFTITLPASAEKPAPPRASAAAEKSAGGETILLVEDDPSVRRVDVRALTMRGYRVLEAAGAEEALKIFESSRNAVRLLLTDVVMPGMDGGALALEIVKRRPGTPVVFVTGYVRHDALDRLGALPYTLLQKPVAPEELAAQVRAALDAAPKTEAASA